MKKLSYGMVGGGPGSFIGDAHRRAINLDGQATLVAGCFSRNMDKCRQTGAELGVAEDRCYVSFEEMAKAEVYSDPLLCLFENRKAITTVKCALLASGGKGHPCHQRQGTGAKKPALGLPAWP